MTIVDPIAASQTTQTTTPSSIYSTPATTAPEQSMDGSMFLQLLVTQLQNQDPSSPMDTDQMISQTTELAQMEQLTTMSNTDTQNFSLQMRTSAAQMLGQQVTYQNAAGDVVTGTATSVTFTGDVPSVNVGKDSVALDQVLAVTAPGQTAPAVTPPPSDSSTGDGADVSSDATDQTDAVFAPTSDSSAPAVV